MTRAQGTDDPAAPARWPWWLALIACTGGLVASILLEQIHVRIHADPTFHSFCALDRTVNCDIVARSEWAVFLGVPVAAWGIYGYAVAMVLAAWGLFSRRPALPAGLGAYLGTTFLAVSAVLGIISAVYVTAVCILCVATYVANAILLVAFLAAARPWGVREALAAPWKALAARPGRWLSIGIVLGALAAGLAVAHPRYWTRVPAKKTQITTPTLPTGTQPGGGHYIGAEAPVLTIVEFSDYECPFCKQAHGQLRALLDRYPTRLRVVHRHYPLDQSCNSTITGRMHENACFAATIAECAAKQNRFWQANDYLFAEARSLHARSNGEIARELGLDPAGLETCLRDSGPRAVAFDVDDGNRLGIRGTPTFFIDGKAYTGQLPPWVQSRLQSGGVDAGSSR